MIIDNKGRLFGKINIIDFFVLVFLFSLIPMLYYGFKLARAPKTPAPVVYSEEKYKQLENQLVYSEEKYRQLENQYSELKKSGIIAIAKYKIIIAKKDAEINAIKNSINIFLNEHKRAERYFK